MKLRLDFSEEGFYEKEVKIYYGWWKLFVKYVL